MGPDAHGRAPGAGAGGGVDLELAELLQAVGELAECAAREPREWEHLAAVGVARELETDAGSLHNRQAAGHVIEQDAGLAVTQMQIFQKGLQTHRVG